MPRPSEQGLAYLMLWDIDHIFILKFTAADSHDVRKVFTEHRILLENLSFYCPPVKKCLWKMFSSKEAEEICMLLSKDFLGVL